MNFPEVQPKSVIIFWEEDDVKQLYSVLKESDSFSARYNDHQKVDSIVVSLI